MNRVGIFLVTGAVLACTACLGESGKLEIRAANSGLKQGYKPVPFRIAEARGHLALGNVGLALEGFRKASRDDPNSIEALAGIADCYDRMGRFDLSRRYYEMALAIAPREAGLLAAFARSLDLQGRTAEATSVRRELADLAAPAAPVVEAAPVTVAGQATPAQAPARVAETPPAATVAAVAPPPLTAPAPIGQSVTIALPPPRPAESPKTRAEAPQQMAVAPVGRSVTIALPPPRPATEAKPQVRVAAPQPAPRRMPRIERLSLTEVALVTSDGPRWRRIETPRMAARTPTQLRLLNAARIDKLAARTRSYLSRAGWRNATIGDAAVVRSQSLIVYPVGAREEAARLSAKLGFAMAPRSGVRQLTVLLGRDAAGHPALR